MAKFRFFEWSKKTSICFGILSLVGLAFAPVNLGLDGVLDGKAMNHRLQPAIAVASEAVPQENCNNTASYLSGSLIFVGSDTRNATATITNSSRTCTAKISFSSYKMYARQNEPGWLTSQTLFDNVTISVAPGQTAGEGQLHVRVPDCTYQIDLYVGDPIFHILETGHTGLFAAAFGTRTNLCLQQAVTRNLSITKGVRDLTQGQTAYVSETNVFNGNSLQFQIVVNNTGNASLQNVFVNDTLPAGLNFVPNSLGISAGAVDNNNISRIVIGTMAAGARVTLTFRANVNMVSGSAINIATVSADGAETRRAEAKVNIVSRPRSGNITVSKLVKNLSRQENTFTGQTTADRGQRVAYQISISAVGQNATNVTVLDTIPAHLEYVVGSARLNGAAFTDAFRTTNTNIGSIAAGSTSTLYFEANVRTNLPVGHTIITNTVNASADNIGTVSSSANVIVSVSAPGGGGGGGGGGGAGGAGGGPAFGQLSVIKVARNLTSQGVFSKNIQASGNDRVAFQVAVTSTGTLTINNAYVYDPLPTGLTLVLGTIRLDNNPIGDSGLNNRLSLVSLAPGQQKVLTFEAAVNPVQQNVTIQNITQAGGDNANTVQDTANITLTAPAVLGANIILNQSKHAFNNTKNIDATLVPADSEDFITYTLTVTNSGNADATGYVISDDLSRVLSYATLVSMEDGILTGNVISWPAVTVPRNGSVQKSFKVRINYYLPANVGNFQLINTYGNTVVIQARGPQVRAAALVAPKTGSNAWPPFAFAVFATVAFAIIKHRLRKKVA